MLDWLVACRYPIVSEHGLIHRHQGGMTFTLIQSHFADSQRSVLIHAQTSIFHSARVLWQAPVGFWDPAGFTADGSTENFARRRQTELKHGRISMLDAWSTFGKTLHLCEIVGSRRYEHLNFEHVYSGKYVCD